MYSIIIRGNIDSEDVEISDNSKEKLQEQIEKIVSSNVKKCLISEE